MFVCLNVCPLVSRDGRYPSHEFVAEYTSEAPIFSPYEQMALAKSMTYLGIEGTRQ